MQSGIVFLPDGRAETRNDIPDDVQLTPWPDWTEAEKSAFSVLVGGLPTVSGNFGIQVAYINMRLAGESHNMAEMLAFKTGPGLKTDAIFNESKFSGHSNEECTARGTWLRREAEKHGVSTNGKWYCSGLASFPGDPKAWVGGRGDVVRVAREKNMNVHGYVEYQGREVDPGGDLKIADDIIEDEVADVLDSHPHANANDVREQVYALRTGAVDGNALRVGDHNFGNELQ